MKKLLLLFACFFNINYFSAAQLPADTVKTWPYVCQADSFPVTLSGVFGHTGFHLDSVLHTYRNDSLLLKYYYYHGAGFTVISPFQVTLKFLTPPPAYYTIYAERYVNNVLTNTSTTHIGVCMGATGISENSSSNTEVYPNPTNGLLNLKNLPPNTLATLQDLTGKLLFRKRLFTNQAELDLQELPAGIYILNLESEAGKSVRKILKY